MSHNSDKCLLYKNVALKLKLAVKFYQSTKLQRSRGWKTRDGNLDMLASGFDLWIREERKDEDKRWPARWLKSSHSSLSLSSTSLEFWSFVNDSLCVCVSLSTSVLPHSTVPNNHWIDFKNTLNTYERVCCLNLRGQNLLFCNINAPSTQQRCYHLHVAANSVYVCGCSSLSASLEMWSGSDIKTDTGTQQTAKWSYSCAVLSMNYSKYTAQLI